MKIDEQDVMMVMVMLVMPLGLLPVSGKGPNQDAIFRLFH